MPALFVSFGSGVGSCLYRRDAEKGQKESPALSPRGLAEGPNHGAPLRSPNPQSAKPGKGAFSSTFSAVLCVSAVKTDARTVRELRERCRQLSLPQRRRGAENRRERPERTSSSQSSR